MQSPFINALFHTDADGSICYNDKLVGPKMSSIPNADIVKQLCKSHTQEEFFDMLEMGLGHLQVMCNKDRGWYMKLMKRVKSRML